MKLYTKKTIYSVLAMGLLVCAPSDAGVVKRKRKERCAGIIIKEARKAGAKGTVTMSEIKLDGGQCTYTGSVPKVPSSTDYDFKERRDKLDKYQEYIAENDKCDPEQKVCLKYKESSVEDAQNKKQDSFGEVRFSSLKQCKEMCSGYFVQQARKNGMKGFLESYHIHPVLQGTINNRKCLCAYIGPETGFPRSATFLQRESKKTGETDILIAEYENASSKDCDSSKKMCWRTTTDQQKLCAGTIIKKARKAGATGTVTMAEIKADGNKCTYTGSVPDVPKSTSYSVMTRGPTRDKYIKYATETNKCDPKSTLCLV